MMSLFYLCLLIVNIATTCVPNPNPLDLIVGQPTLLNNITNGQKLIIGDPSDPNGNYIYIANLKGTPKEMGEAFGTLFKDQIHAQMKLFFSYYLDQLKKLLIEQKLPTFLANGLTSTAHGLGNQLLDLNILITKKYTSPRYYQQIKGIAKGAQVSAKQIERINIVPEIIKAACTVAGVWKSASKNGQTLHMRALDWDAGNPINKFPLITVYHPSDKNSQVHANIGWVGFVGVLTGMSPKLSIGQKVWLPPKNSVKMTRYGNPWTYVLRDVLYDAKNMTEAISILTKAHRTCAIHLGIASADDHTFRMFEYSENILNNYDDANYTHYNSKSHPKMPGIAYFDKHVQPSGDDCVGTLLTNNSYYGNWEAENFWRVVGNTHKTGDTQLIVFNLERQEIIVSYSKNYDEEGGKVRVEEAYLRSPIWVDMGKLWADF